MLLVFADIFFQKVQFFNVDGLSILLVLLYFAMCFYFITNKVAVDITSVLLIGAIVALAIISYMISDVAKLTSLMLFVSIYLPFIFYFKKNITEASYIYVVRLFIYLLSFVWLFGLLQIIFSYSNGQVVDPIHDALTMLGCCFLDGYMPPYEAIYGSGIYKPNGFVLLEPSFFSQFMALGLIAELIFFKRLIFISIFFSGVLLSFSGTGILLFIFFIMLSIYRLKYLKYYLVGLVFLLFLYVSFAEYFQEIFFKRIDEFTTEGSSAFLRFVGPYMAMYDATDGFIDFFIGHGPGSVDFIENNILAYPADFTGLSKLYLEYGFMGLMLFFIYSYYLIVNSFSPTFVMSILFAILFLSGGLLQIHTVLLLFVFSALYRVRVLNVK